jgi:hypothetical protein
MLYRVKEAAEMGDVFLATADGSIVCQEDPVEQESTLSSHYCEVVSALHIRRRFITEHVYNVRA